jgi:hypothetical protein
VSRAAFGVMLLAAGCGRIGFGAQDGDGGLPVDAGPTVDAHAMLGDPVKIVDLGSPVSCPSLWPRAGGGFALAWLDFRNGNWDVYAALLDPTGARITPERRITTTASGDGCPSIARIGEVYRIAFDDHETADGEIMTAELGSDGVIIGSTQQVTADAGDAQHVEVASGATQLALAWDETIGANTGIQVIDEFARRTATDSGVDPTIVAADGDRFAVLWYENATPSTLHQGWAENGVVGDTPIAVARGGGVGPPAAAWTGSTLAMIWVGASGLLAATFDGAVATVPVPLDEDGTDPRLLWAGTRLALLFVRASKDLVYVPVSLDGALADRPTLIAADSSRAALGRIPDPARLLVVYPTADRHEAVVITP